ncbi:MAG: DUF308 domain-containing protein [Paludibacteraceae bacterium]
MSDFVSAFWGVSRHWGVLLLVGILTLVCGVWFLFQPENAYVMIATLFGLSLLSGGIIQLISASKNRKSVGWGWLFFAGICDVIIGFYLVANTGFTEDVLPFIFSFVVFFRGMLVLLTSLRMRKVYRTWWVYLLNGILMLALSSVFMFFPFSSIYAIVFVSSLMMIYWGISWIYLAIDLRPRHLK